jgi:hypothetical protein
MGGVMKLGKALATGVAEERPEDHVVHGDGLELHEELRDLQDLQGLEASASADAPAAR